MKPNEAWHGMAWAWAGHEREDAVKLLRSVSLNDP